MKLIKKWTGLAVLLLMSGCATNNVQKKIADKVNDCNSSTCMITITQLTDFHWEKMIVFNYVVSLDEINKAIGTDYPYWEEYTRPIIFLYKKKIVHYENNRANLEHIIDGQVVFDYPDSLKYKVYTPRNSVFKAKKVTMQDGVYYELQN